MHPIVLRCLAVIATVVVPLVAARADALSANLAAMLTETTWIAPVAAGALVLPIALARRRTWTSVLLGGSLAALSANDAGSVGRDLAFLSDPPQIPSYDLREGPLPDDASGYVRVTGYLRDQGAVSEYAVADGERPDQSKPPVARLMPIVYSTENELELRGRVVVARVRPDHVAGTGDQGTDVLIGKLGPIDETILLSIVGVAGDEAAMQGVVLDTLVRPERKDLLTSLAVSVIASLLALVLLWIAVGSRQQGTQPQEPSQPD